MRHGTYSIPTVVFFIIVAIAFYGKNTVPKHGRLVKVESSPVIKFENAIPMPEPLYDWEVSPARIEHQVKMDNMRDEFKKTMKALERVKQGFIDMEDPLQKCGDPCVVANNGGGHLVAFQYAVQTLDSRKKYPVEIHGVCASACASFAALARDRGAGVCITRSTVFWFHLTNSGTIPPLPANVRDWVLENGGFPPYDSKMLTPMAWPNTNLFWPVCGRARRASKNG